MSDRTEKVLVIDDKQSIVEILETALGEAGYQTDSALDGTRALELAGSDDYDLVLCDVKLPDISGTEILKKIKENKNAPAVIMITAYGSIENAIECMKLGADDYVTKPFNLEEITEIVKKGLEKTRLLRENRMLREELEDRYKFSGIIGKSKPMMDIFERIKRIARTNVSVLISGDTGVGKELVARALHYNSGRRGKLVPVNCAAIPENLMESELFGHARGAFTGAVTAKKGLIEDASGGTLLLDEIADLYMPLQAKLLRTLDEAAIRRVGDNDTIPVDVRLICSTNKDLAEEVEAGRFRLDLYHRIKVMEIVIPPLRERREDIIPLAEHYLANLAEHHDREIHGFSSEAAGRLLGHDWPGNVRELINVLEQAVLLCENDIIDTDTIDPLLSPPSADCRQPQFVLTDGTLKEMLGRVEKDIISRVLEEEKGSRKATAKRLGLSERALYYKLDEYGLK